jgi:hypothetical protein
MVWVPYIYFVSTEFCNYGYMINLQVDSINVCLDEYDMFRTLLLEAKYAIIYICSYNS